MSSLQCAGCAHANELGARFCAQCGASLASRCFSCGAELPVAARFCSSCGAAVAADPVAVADGALKVVSVVFADLVGSTALQEALDTESVRRVMTRFYEVMRAVVERHAGALQKFIGDAVVVVFGAPVVGEDDALRAVRCAVEMVAALDELNAELEPTFGVRLQVRTGVNTGELVVNDEGIFVGDTMNTAARFEQAAGAGEVLIGEATRRLVRHQAELEQIEPLALKGKSEPVRAWRVLSVAAGPAQRLESPLVGRAGELGRLRSVLDDAVTSRCCRLVTVVGSPGLGKSRLAQEFAAAVAGQATVLAGHCEPSGEGITFLPVADVLRGAAGIGEADPSEAVVEKLSALLPLDADRDRIVARAAGLLGAGESASPEETFWSVRRLLEAVAARGPLVVVLDDVHWGQPLFLDLIEHLVEWVRDAPLLLVALARPELREVREVLTSAGRRASEVIELDPLDSGESRELVEGLLGHVDLPAPLLERILETSDGNPLFLGELLRMLVDEGALVRTGDEWVAASGADAVQVPPTIHALLTARIERLQPHERSVVERASVIGKQFYRGAVAELVAPSVRLGIDGHLEMLRRKDMVEPEGIYWIDEPVYRFHHVLIRDAAYHLLLKEARAELHERFADWLATKAGELVGEHEEVIAYHLEQAFAYRRQLGPLDERGREIGDRAASLLWSAGRRALGREDLAAAANLLQRAHECSADDAVLWDLGEALLSAGDTASAAVVVDKLSGPRRVVLETQLAVLTGAGADLPGVIAATAKLAANDDGVGAAKGHHVTAQVQAQLGQVADVEASLDKALLAARNAGDRRRITAVLAAAPRAALWGPSPVVRASGRCLDVVRILRMTPGNRHVEAIALRCQAVLEAMRGRADAAREILNAGRTTLEELGLTLELHELALHAGIVELLDDRPADAETLLRAARDGFASLGVSVSAAQAAALLGRALVDQGPAHPRDEEAVAETEFAERRAGGDLKTTITWCGVRAEALARRGALDQAVVLAQRAVALAEPIDALADKADANMALARVLTAAGRGREARAAAAEAQRLYKEKDHLVGAKRAERLAGAPVVTTTPTPASISGVPDPAIAEVLRQFDQAWRARDHDRLVEIYPPGEAVEDHRQLGWGRLRGEKWRDGVRSVLEMWDDVRVEIVDVVACADGVIAARMKWLGHGSETGGEIEIDLGTVTVIRDGRMVSVDYYEPDDRESMLARFAELTGAGGRLGDRPPERWWARFATLFAQHDRAGLAAMWSEDMVLVDHRAVGWEEVHGLDAMLDLADSAWATSPDVRAVIDEVMACNEHVSAIRLRYVGSAADGGGAIEIPVGYVSVFADGVAIRGEQFDPGDRDAMFARYRELGGTVELAVRPAELWLRELERVWSSHDAELINALFDHDFAMRDHRTVAMWDEVQGRADQEALIASALAVGESKLSVDDVLACDDHVVAARIAWRGQLRDGGGEYSIEVGAVSVVRDGVQLSMDVYDPDERQAMIARYAELGGGQARLGDRPPERLWKELARRFASRDLDAILELYDEDWRHVDHRGISWDEMHGLAHAKELVRSALDISSDLWVEFGEVLACDESVIAFTSCWRGSGAGEIGAIELPMAWVSVVENGQLMRQDMFEPEDRDAMLARYVELGGGQTAVLGDRPPERLLAEHVRRFNAHDVAGVSELVSDDVVYADHRRVAPGGAEGREQYERVGTTLFEIAPDVRVEVNEVLACDDRVIAARTTYSGASAGEAIGAYERSNIEVWLLGHDGLAVRTDHYDDDNPQAALARYAELGGGLGALEDSPVERVFAEFSKRYAAHDLESLLDLLTEDFRWTDHRNLAWEPVRGRDGVAALVRSGWGGSTDIRIEVDEVVACDGRVLAVRFRWVGRDDRGGAFELPAGQVVVNDGARNRSVDQLDYDDRATLIARYAELGGGAGPLGDRPPERFFKSWLPLSATGDIDAMSALVAEDFLRIDHRKVGWEPLRGRPANVALWRSAHETAADLRMEVDEVLACDERVIAWRFSWCGRWNGAAGDFAVNVGQVNVIEDGVWLSCDQYNAEDRDAMLARYAELTAGPALPASERHVRRWYELFANGDIEALVALHSPDWVLRDHRRFGSEELRGFDGARAHVTAVFESSPDIRGEVEEVLAADDRVIAYRVVFRGTGDTESGGPFEVGLGAVLVVEQGLRVLLEYYEPDDQQAMLARYAELAKPFPLRMWAEYERCFNAGDVDGTLAGFSEDYVVTDHRRLALWEEIRGREDWGRMLRGLLAPAGVSVQVEMGEVLACDEHVIAHTVRFFGTDARGGEYEWVPGFVQAADGERVGSTDIYDSDDRRAMIARYAELGGGASRLGDRPPERVWAEYLKRWASRDIDRVVDLVDDDVELSDHREIGWKPTRGAAHYERVMRAAFDTWSDSWIEIDQVLACDEERIALLVTYRGSGLRGATGPAEIRLGQVCTARDGFFASLDYFDPDDRDGMLARFEELGGKSAVLGDSPVEQLVLEATGSFNEHDFDRHVLQHAEDFVLVDHRSLGWAEVRGREAFGDLVRSALAVSDDVRFDIEEVIACDGERVIALRGAWRGGGSGKAGAWEIPIGYVTVFKDRLLASHDFYEYDDMDAMRARFAELTRSSRQRGTRSDDAFNRRDLAAMAETYAQDIVLIDHRNLGWERFQGRAAVLEQAASLWRHMSEDIQVASQEVIAFDGRAFARVASYRGTARDGGGELDLALGQVGVMSGDQIERLEWFDPDDRQAMIVRYVEIGGGLRPLGDRPPERWWAEVLKAYARADLDKLVQLYAEDWRGVDHRNLGWEETHGREGIASFWRSALAVSTDQHGQIDEVVACDDRAIAVRITWRGTSTEGGGEFALQTGDVGVAESGRSVSQDVFDHADTDAMLARYAELGGRRPPGSRPPERFWAEFVDRFNAHDIESLRNLWGDDWLQIDHRPVGWERRSGREAAEELLRSALSVAPDLRLEIDEMIACDDRISVFTGGWRGTTVDGGGEFSVSIGLVAVVEAGRVVREELYEPEERRAMIAKYAELGGGSGPLGDRPPEQSLKRYMRAYASRDLDAILGIVSKDWILIDHRQIGWGELRGHEGQTEVMRSGWDATVDVRMEVDEVLACNERVVAIRGAWRGTMLDGKGPFESAMGLVIHPAGMDLYEPDDRDAMLASYAELGGRHEELGDRPPERLLAEHVRAFNAHFADRVVALADDDFTYVDHRPIGVGDFRGRGKYERTLRSMMEYLPRLDVEEVLACDDRVIALRALYRVTSAKDSAAEGERSCGEVWLVRDGRFVSLDHYEPDDRHAMIARYAELGGGLGRLGNAGSERTFAEYARRYAARDLDGLLALCSDDWRLIDHRQIGWGEMDRDRYAAEMPTVWSGVADVRIEIDEVIAADDRVLAGICTYRGTAAPAAGGGLFEYSVGFVSCSEAGVGVSDDWYEPGNRDTILARFTDLSNTPREYDELRPYHRFDRLYNERRMDELPALYTDDYVMVDRRSMAWEELHGGQALADTCRSFLDSAPDLRSVCVVLEEDESGEFVLLRNTFTGQGCTAGGAATGPVELVFIEVGVQHGDQICRTELFDPADEPAARARYEGLRNPRPLPVRLYESMCEAFNERDLDRAVALHQPDTVMRDHRQMPWDPTDTVHELAEVWRAVAESVTDARYEPEFHLATDEHLCVTLKVEAQPDYGGGPAEVVMADAVGCRGRLMDRHDIYDDPIDALACTGELIGGGRGETVTLIAGYLRAYRDRDWRTLAELWAPDAVIVDHRSVGLGTVEGAADVLQAIRGLVELTPDARTDAREFLELTDRTALYRHEISGHDTAGGAMELAMLIVVLVRYGRIARAELFELEHETAARARHRALRP